MHRVSLDGKTYNYTQLAKRWGVSINTCSRIIQKIGVEKAEAFYMRGEPIIGEIYEYKIKATLSDGKTYTMFQLANMYNLEIRNLYYAYNISKSTKEFEERLHKLIAKNNNVVKKYKISNGCELTIGQLAYLWKITERCLDRYIKIHGIEEAEKHYIKRLKRLYSKEIREKTNADNSSKG